MNKSTLTLIGIIILAIGLAGGFFIGNYHKNGEQTPIETGNSNTSPPTENQPPSVDGWETSTDTVEGVSFQYPRGLTATYIDPVDWPPKAEVSSDPFSCTGDGNENGQAGKSENLTVNNNTYCVTKVSEGAAGSTYIQYSYKFAKNNKVVILTFSLRFPQCANYDDPQKTACENERQSFDINELVDQIAQTIKLS